MATTGWHFWSTTANTNATADSAVNWAEGQAPSTVNDSARALMASAAKGYKDSAGQLTTAGTSTAYTVATNQVFASASDMSGARITFIPHTTSGASPTLAVDGLTARQIRSATAVNVATGALIAGTPYTVTYIHASTEFILHNVLSGALSASSLALSGTLSVGGAATFSAEIVGAVAQFNNTVSCAAGLNVVGSVVGASTISGTSITAANALSGATAAGNMVATQAEMETGTATNKLVPPGRQHFHAGHPKAWGVFSGTTGALMGGYNVASTSRQDAGDYTVTFTNSVSTTSYVVNITPRNTTDGSLTCRVSTTKGTGSFTIKVQKSDNTDADPTEVMFTVMGDL